MSMMINPFRFQSNELDMLDFPDASPIVGWRASQVPLNEGDVAQVNDRVGSNHLVQASESLQSAWTEEDVNFNNKPTVVHDGTEWMRAAGLDIGDDWTMFVVGSRVASSGNTTWIGHGNNTGDRFGHGVTNLSLMHSNGVQIQSLVDNAGFPGLYILRNTGGAGSYILKNYVQVTSGSVGSVTWADIYMGSRGCESIILNGRWAEAVIIPGASTSADLNHAALAAVQRYGMPAPFPGNVGCRRLGRQRSCHNASRRCAGGQGRECSPRPYHDAGQQYRRSTCDPAGWHLESSPQCSFRFCFRRGRFRQEVRRGRRCGHCEFHYVGQRQVQGADQGRLAMGRRHRQRCTFQQRRIPRYDRHARPSESGPSERCREGVVYSRSLLVDRPCHGVFLSFWIQRGDFKRHFGGWIGSRDRERLG